MDDPTRLSDIALVFGVLLRFGLLALVMTRFGRTLLD
jgi:hypothetical protein